MKSEDYVKMFREDVGKLSDPTQNQKREIISKIVILMCKEGEELHKKRKVMTPTSLANVWDQMDSVWRAFVHKLPEEHLNLDVFCDVIKTQSPKLYEAVVMGGGFHEYTRRLRKKRELEQQLNLR